MPEYVVNRNLSYFVSLVLYQTIHFGHHRVGATRQIEHVVENLRRRTPGAAFSLGNFMLFLVIGHRLDELPIFLISLDHPLE